MATHTVFLTLPVIHYEGRIDHHSYTPNLNSCEIICITAMINAVFISFSAVQIYDISHLYNNQINACALIG